MNLVIGAAVGYTYEQIKPFLFTLKKTGYKGDICLFVNYQTSEEDIKLLIDEGVMVYRIQKYLNYIPKFVSERRFARILKPLHWLLPKLPSILPVSNIKRNLLIGSISSFFLSVACSRYYYYYKFLSQKKFKYDFVLFSDVRDVVFQSNPFDKLNGNETILLAMEHETCLLGKDSSNSRWIKHLYEKEGIDRIENFVVSCSGTTLAKKGYYENYLTEMILETAKQTHKIVGAFGFDQGIHNYLFRTNKIKNYSMQFNGSGIYCTMLTTPINEILLNNRNQIVNRDGSLVPIVHQYNWFPSINLDVLANI